MSNVNIRRAVENIRANTTVHTPVVETIVNAIKRSRSQDARHGKVSVRVHRNLQTETDGSLPEVHTLEIEDNGVGFTKVHRDSFDTLYTDQKIEEGGRWTWRFTCLKYFEDVRVSSTYRDRNEWKTRSFTMGKGTDIIVNEKVTVAKKQESGTIVTLNDLKKGRSLDKKLSTIAEIWSSVCCHISSPRVTYARKSFCRSRMEQTRSI